MPADVTVCRNVHRLKRNRHWKERKLGKFPLGPAPRPFIPYVSRVEYSFGWRAPKRTGRTGIHEGPSLGSARPPICPAPLRGPPRQCGNLTPPSPWLVATGHEGCTCPRPGGGTQHRTHTGAIPPKEIRLRTWTASPRETYAPWMCSHRAAPSKPATPVAAGAGARIWCPHH